VSVAFVGALTYDPYGGIVQQHGIIPTPLGFAGEWHDPTTGLQYLRARWYQPQTGRFTQVDPFAGFLTLPATQHPYQYGLNNPVRYTDPSGEIAVGAVVGAAAVGAAIGAATGGIGHVARNPGRSLGEYVKDAEFRKAVGVGAASGAVAGAVAALTPFGLAALGLKATTAGSAALIGGITGALAGGAGQLTHNLLTPCTPWQQNLGGAMLGGAVFGAAAGFGGWHLRQWLASTHIDWSTYPQNPKVPRPKGPLRILEGAEYDAARAQANAANRALHRANPSLRGLHIHEIHPVKFGGSPTDIANKVALTPSEHTPFTNWWAEVLRGLTSQ
jgi:RHS repeat-associated protein